MQHDQHVKDFEWSLICDAYIISKNQERIDLDLIAMQEDFAASYDVED